ncbi:methyltransferase domain-containing protein [Methanolacinia paynteri]|uniref:methyltransferase domain-containing protein n=1 Tax=Methanolacinia paynteri TaxID=230356 RepID=UPI00064E2E41|nr:methyltransferase domain-containing protein [Methanolacinia paynteri]
MSERGYVHGYSETESERLSVQAATLNELLYGDTSYPAGSLVLEAGCGTGAQTPVVTKNSPGAVIISVDISQKSLAAAKKRATAEGNAAEYLNCDIFGLPFPEDSFDHIFVCFVLEHLRDPVDALTALMRVLKPGGTITVIEGDHGSAFFHPESAAAKRNIGCLVKLQAEAGGDALIGRRLSPLLRSAGLDAVSVSPRMVYVDSSRPDLVEGFTRKTFTAMVEGVGEDAVSSGMMTKEEWDEGISALYRTAEEDGTFCYTFFKATGTRPV